MPKGLTYVNSGDSDAAFNNFVEISIDPIVLNNYSSEEGMTAYFNNYASSEEFQSLRNDLVKEIMIIIDTRLTKKQKEVIMMTYLEGKTQNEISTELGKHQTTVHKILKGNIDYNNQKKRYGGALKKIRKICITNKKIQEILLKMRENLEKVKQA